MFTRKQTEMKSIISQEIKSVIEEEDKMEKNQARRYYRHNISFDKLEEQHIYKPHLSHTKEDLVDTIFDFSEAIENKNLYQSLKQLKEIDKKIINMRYVEQLSFKEIAEQLAMKEDTVGKRHRRALDKLKKSMF